MFRRLLSLVVLLPALYAGAALAEDNNIELKQVQNGGEYRIVAVIHRCSEATITIDGESTNLAASHALPFTMETTGTAPKA